MPLKPHNPKVVKISGPKVSKELTEVRLHRVVLLIDQQDEDAITIEVRWSQGYLEGEGEEEKYVASENGKFTFSGDDSNIPMKKPIGNTSLLEEIREAVWGMLHAKEKVPKGKLS
jgi:hypothetical protein